MSQNPLKSDKSKEVGQKTNQEVAMHNKTLNYEQNASQKIVDKNDLVASSSDELKAQFLQLLLSRKYLEEFHKEVFYNNEDKQKVNLETHLFRGFLSYASDLYFKKKITQDTYISLIEKAAESYIESLYESSINRFLDKYEAYLKKALMG